MKKKTKVLVIGAPRSGTTLLAGLLSAGKEASPMLPECSHITAIIQHFHNILHYSDPQRFAAYAIDEPTLSGMYRGMVDSMLDTVQSHFNDIDYRYLILKDPELTPLIDLIPCFFGEDSKTVCVVRDPRAVIASMLEVESKKKNPWSAWIKTPSRVTTSELLNQIFRTRRLIAYFFQYYWNVHESQLYKRGATHVVRYEKIVARDEDEFKRLEEYLGFAVGREGFGKVHFDFDRTDPTYSAGYGREIQATSPDFRKKLTHWQIKKIEVAFSGLNAIYGWWK
ncbi:MAG TPA: sulfotransferase [Rugosibacter sp.]|nr:sulfotransferase [Rugosibacter sp.]